MDRSPPAAEVERGFLLATVMRSIFTAIPFEALDRPDGAALQQLLADRIRLTSYLLSWPTSSRRGFNGGVTGRPSARGEIPEVTVGGG